MPTPAAFREAFAQVDLVSKRIKVSRSFVKLAMIISLLNAETYLENITVILNVNISLPKHYIFECHDICHF